MIEKRKPGVTFWATIALIALPILYVLSVGPACWWFARDAEFESYLPARYAPKAYWPMGWAVERSDAVRRVVGWYVGYGGILLPTDSTGNSWVAPSDPFYWIGQSVMP